ncbi:MAG: DNA-binding transcriptional regulator OxyR [Gallionellales bacterium 35-53-114]|jgi:LysR family hydrogen peroxide-inducible transcriptional activator|nr:MAG: DNA-binding transcriptional regulator OxyR [Gallionellales bacterium 35-53-114]OYZ64785.1 MAG: DNA-binding transcriptional regulator OxyR [Gallionellales bacterium 24-53-125]OZB07676.1 MAG: DNA-binding transcriptional regulator OxyR [Gallionellales bacterium 39-52-133]HQS58630.1 LysR substrate-binding domain-containing protein [Gallionellaceae bacterium]HQS74971.1 LysR substrate-binding domain-containing protein [Gallionellaceae bacterium]
MTLQELRYIVALADTGHFGKAAETCYISQSTLSTQVKKLEDFLGVMLFDRSLKHVALTPIGHEIVSSARLILDEATRIRELARLTGDPMERTVNLGVIPTLGPYYLPHVLTLLHGKFPKLRLLLREEMTPHLLSHLADGKLDAGLLALPVNDASLEVVPLFKEPFLAAVPANHKLAQADSIKINELAQAGLLLLEEGHCLREHALEACHLDGMQNEEISATSLETLRQMVGMGLGVTLIPVLASGGTTADITQVALRPLVAPGASRTVGLVWRKRSPLASTMEQLVITLKNALPPHTLPIS